MDIPNLDTEEDENVEYDEEENEDDEVEALDDNAISDAETPLDDLSNTDKLLLARCRHDQIEEFESKLHVCTGVEFSKESRKEMAKSECALLKNHLNEWASLMQTDDGSPSTISTEEICRRAQRITAPRKKSYPCLSAPRRKAKLDPVLKNEICAKLAENPCYVPPTTRKLLLRDASFGVCAHPIAVIDDIQGDTSTLPTFPEFHYISKNDMTSLDSNRDNPITYSCDCEDGCTSGSCRCVSLNNAMNKENGPTMTNGVVYIKKPVTDVYSYALVTCGELCQCPSTCPNRVENVLKMAHFEIYRGNPITGFGVRTLTSIPFGRIVAEFTGVVKSTSSLAESKEDEVDHEEWALELGCGQDNPMEIDAVHTSMEHIIKMMQKSFVQNDMVANWEGALPKDHLFIDPVDKGNESKYFSHGCWPNLQLLRVVSNYVNTEGHRLVFYAKHDIPAGTELTFNYGKQYISTKKFVCQCQTVLCRRNHNSWNLIGNDLKSFTILDIMKTVQHKWKIVRKETDYRLCNLYYEAKRKGKIIDSDGYYHYLDGPANEVGMEDDAAAAVRSNVGEDTNDLRTYERIMKRQENMIPSEMGSMCIESDGNGNGSSKRRGRPLGSKNRSRRSPFLSRSANQRGLQKKNRKRSSPDTDDETSSKEDSKSSRRDGVLEGRFLVSGNAAVPAGNALGTLRSGVPYLAIESDPDGKEKLDVEILAEQTNKMNSTGEEEMSDDSDDDVPPVWPPITPEDIVEDFLWNQLQVEKRGRKKLELEKAIKKPVLPRRRRTLNSKATTRSNTAPTNSRPMDEALSENHDSATQDSGSDVISQQLQDSGDARDGDTDLGQHRDHERGYQNRRHPGSGPSRFNLGSDHGTHYGTGENEQPAARSDGLPNTSSSFSDNRSQNYDRPAHSSGSDVLSRHLQNHYGDTRDVDTPHGQRGDPYNDRERCYADGRSSRYPTSGRSRFNLGSDHRIHYGTGENEQPAARSDGLPNTSRSFSDNRSQNYDRPAHSSGSDVLSRHLQNHYGDTRSVEATLGQRGGPYNHRERGYADGRSSRYPTSDRSRFNLGSDGRNRHGTGENEQRSSGYSRHPLFGDQGLRGSSAQHITGRTSEEFMHPIFKTPARSDGLPITSRSSSDNRSQNSDSPTHSNGSDAPHHLQNHYGDTRDVGALLGQRRGPYNERERGYADGRFSRHSTSDLSRFHLGSDGEKRNRTEETEQQTESTVTRESSPPEECPIIFGLKKLTPEERRLRRCRKLGVTPKNIGSSGHPLSGDQGIHGNSAQHTPGHISNDYMDPFYHFYKASVRSDGVPNTSRPLTNNVSRNSDPPAHSNGSDALARHLHTHYGNTRDGSDGENRNGTGENEQQPKKDEGVKKLYGPVGLSADDPIVIDD